MLTMRSSRLDGTRLVMMCVVVCIVTAIVQRAYDVRQLSRCVDALDQAHDVVTDLMVRLDGAKVKRCK
jgi:hypothetical protein